MTEQSFVLRLVPSGADVTAFYVPVGAEFSIFLGRHGNGYLDTLWHNKERASLDLNYLTAPAYQLADRYLLTTEQGQDPQIRVELPQAQLIGHMGYDDDDPDNVDNPLWTPEWVTPVWIAKVGTEIVYANDVGQNVRAVAINEIHNIPEPEE